MSKKFTDIFERDQDNCLVVPIPMGRTVSIPEGAVRALECDTGIYLVQLALYAPMKVNGVLATVVPVDAAWYYKRLEEFYEEVDA